MSDDSGDECSLPFQSPNHAERIMVKMEVYHSKRQLCDVVLIAQERRIKVDFFFPVIVINVVSEVKVGRSTNYCYIDTDHML